MGLGKMGTEELTLALTSFEKDEIRPTKLIFGGEFKAIEKIAT